MSDDLIDSYFRAASEDEKIEAFDASTTSMILKQLGVDAGRIRQLQSEYGTAYGLSWLTEELGLDADIWAYRFFNYNIKDALLNPAKTPILKAYDEHLESADASVTHYMIFKAFDIGRLVAMSAIPPNRPYLCMRQGDAAVYVTTFPSLFSDIFGDDYDP
jgi:hypothetical protein